MNAESHTAFLRRVRRRLWLERMLHQLAIALGLGTACMLLMAIAIVAGFELPARFVAATTITIIAVLTLKALYRRPTLAETARRADQVFGSKSLFATAYDIERSGKEMTRSATLVLQRAAHLVASEGSARLPQLWSAPPLNRFALFILPGFLAGALLVYTSGAEIPVETSNVPALFTPAMQSAAAPDIDNLQASIRRDSAKSASNNDPVVTPASAEVKTASADDSSAMTVTETELESAESSATRLRAPGAGTGDEAGTATNASATAITQRDLSLQRTQSIEIDRKGLAMASRRAAAQQFDNRAGGASTSSSSLAAAAAPPSVTGWSSLSAAQSAYARSYLHERNEQGVQTNE